MWLRLFPCAVLAACTGVVQPTDSGRATVPATESEPVSVDGPGPGPVVVDNLDERIVNWVRELERDRGRRALEALVDGGDVEARLRFAQARAVLGRTVEAEHRFRQILAADSDCAAAGLGLARVLMSHGSYAGAAEQLQAVRALELSGTVPIGADTAWMLGACLLQGADPQAGDRVLREELATGAGFASAALVLANHFAGREALLESLAIVDAGRLRGPGRRDLFLARIRMLADLWRHAEAVPELRAWVDQHPGDGRAQEALVHSLRAVGDPSGALAELGRLIVPADRGDTDRQLELANLADAIDLERRGGVRRFTGGELLAILRGGETAEFRRRAFEALLAAEETRARAMFVAWQQPHVDLRVAVVRAVRPGESGVQSLLEDGLADGDALVRGAAAERCGELDKDDGIPLLSAALAVEDHPYAFRCVHKALQRHFGPVVFLPHAEEKTATGRAQTVAAWRQIWNQ